LLASQKTLDISQKDNIIKSIEKDREGDEYAQPRRYREQGRSQSGFGENLPVQQRRMDPRVVRPTMSVSTFVQ
jgi:hypothetical protein